MLSAKAKRILKISRRLQGVHLKAEADKQRERIQAGASFRDSLERTFAVTIEASRRAHGLEHYPVQVAGGVDLARNRVIEMQTGEGKTLTAILPVALHAMVGKGVHVLTANDYLAKRDAEFAKPILEQLGLSAGYVQSDMEDERRVLAYRCDVTYGTGTEMGFDFLRDRLRLGPRSEVEDALGRTRREELLVQRGHYFALVDEADHLLIDDATTPLLIALEQEEPASKQVLYRWASETASALKSQIDYEFDAERHAAHLTDSGLRKVALLRKPTSMLGISMEGIFEQVETSLVALRGFARGRDYIVSDDEVTIISESTGRQLTGRKWVRGLHFAVEAKEGVPFGRASATAAQITVQAYFGLYQNLAGMTGTAWNCRRELRKYYRTPVKIIPTHRPCMRQPQPTRIYRSRAAKYDFVVEEVRAVLEAGRAVLVGTPSVAASDTLATLLARHSVNHTVLNAVQHEHESETIAGAGKRGRVTIATNMAGRGTDIRLEDGVCRAGGLHVIATEIHTSTRIDRQLVGRAARQGDPGSFRFVLSLEDELFHHAPDLQRALQRKASRLGHEELSGAWIKYFRRVQEQVEHQGRRNRLLSHVAATTRHELAIKSGLDPYLEMIMDE